MVALKQRKQIFCNFDQQSRSKKGNKNSKNYFDNIPNELISSIIARVASSSVLDLYNVKLSCNSLGRICDDGYVLKHATLDKFPVFPWHVKSTNELSQIAFVEMCQKNGNPEALYRKGVVDYFTGGSRDDAIECLKMAKEDGHLGAFYAIGLLLLLSGEKQRGIQYLGTIKKNKNLIKEVTKCRNKLKSIVGSMWTIHNDQMVKEMSTCCNFKNQHPYKKGWCLEEDEKYIKCEACLCDIEVSCIYASLPNKIL